MVNFINIRHKHLNTFRTESSFTPYPLTMIKMHLLSNQISKNWKFSCKVTCKIFQTFVNNCPSLQSNYRVKALINVQLTVLVEPTLPSEVKKKPQDKQVDPVLESMGGKDFLPQKATLKGSCSCSMCRQATVWRIETLDITF